MIGYSIRNSLMRENCNADWTRDGTSAESAVFIGHFNLVLLDPGLRGKSGREILRSLRARKSHIPVIVATVRDAVDDRIRT